MSDQTASDPKLAAKPDAMVWLGEIEAAQRDMQSYISRCQKIRKLYRYQNSRSTNRRQYQIFWANIETMKPAVYAKTPKAMVESRFRTNDPVARVASLLLERTIQFQFDVNDYDRSFKQLRDDYLLYARGVPRLRYEPEFEEAEIEEGLDDVAMTGSDVDSEETEPGQVLKFENIHCDYVQLEDLIHPKARTWEELPWLAYRAFLSRPELEKRFPEYAKSIPLENTDLKARDDGKGTDSATAKATIYEIWDKANGRVLWIAKGCAEILDESEPYLKLTGFFPSPRPAYGTLTNDSLEPVPDFAYYQDQVEEINDLTARIGALTDALKLVGFYPSGPQGEGAPEVERAMTPGIENRMIAVKAWAAFTDGGKNGVPIVWLPVEMVAKIIVECINLRKQLIDDVFQITGISDIMRGDTDASETKGAQTLKAQYSTNRIKERREEVSRVARDVVCMAGEIIAEQFQLDTMMQVANIKLPSQQDVQMAQQQAMLQFQQAQQQWKEAAQMAQQQGQQPPPPPQPPQPPDLGPTQEDVLEFVRNGVTRRFRLDIETDSTVAGDEAQEKQDRTQFIQSISTFITAWGPIIQQAPMLAPLAGQLLLFGVRAFPVARELENVIEEAMDAIQQQANQPRQPPPPSPDEQLKLESTKIKAQAEQQKAQMDMQSTAAKHQMDMQQAQTDHEIKMRTMNQEMQLLEQKAIAQQAMRAMMPAQPPHGQN